eukprot:6173916-Pleurochrysis_carterae.AAC.2
MDGCMLPRYSAAHRVLQGAYSQPQLLTLFAYGGKAVMATIMASPKISRVRSCCARRDCGASVAAAPAVRERDGTSECMAFTAGVQSISQLTASTCIGRVCEHLLAPACHRRRRRDAGCLNCGRRHRSCRAERHQHRPSVSMLCAECVRSQSCDA